MRPLISVVIPMHDEAENAEHTLRAVADELRGHGWEYELIPVDDGSSDGTSGRLRKAAADDASVRPVIYTPNRGRGYALRRGFAKASGSYVVSLDADLSYSPQEVSRMIDMLLADSDVDMVLASPYMPGGGVDGVPFVRLAVSRVGNLILRRALEKPVYTSTGICRAYRAGVLRALDLESDDKEIHLEILSKAMVLGFNVAEMPATLAVRRHGRSHFNFHAIVGSHLLFSLLERPAAVFGLVGILLLAASAAIGAFLLGVYFSGELNPERPLMTLMVLLFAAGQGGLGFAVLATQMLNLRREIVRLNARVAGLDSPGSDARD